MKTKYDSGSLYIVATPIGNLADISQRMQEVLSSVDLLACEDTRHTGRLLTHMGIKADLTSYHRDNEQQKTAYLLNKLGDGLDIALVSDAGTPGSLTRVRFWFGEHVSKASLSSPSPAPQPWQQPFLFLGCKNQAFISVDFQQPRRASGPSNSMHSRPLTAP